MAPWLSYTLITLAAYVGMEFMAWFTHKYLMHGWLWQWHEDHHRPKHQKVGFFEKNDRFFWFSLSRLRFVICTAV